MHFPKEGGEVLRPAPHLHSAQKLLLLLLQSAAAADW